MTHTLRNKIAEAIWDEYDTTKPGLNYQQAQQLADAVIQAIPMHPERGRLRVTRYVTSWYIDDEE